MVYINIIPYINKIQCIIYLILFCFCNCVTTSNTEQAIEITHISLSDFFLTSVNNYPTTSMIAGTLNTNIYKQKMDGIIVTNTSKETEDYSYSIDGLLDTKSGLEIIKPEPTKDDLKVFQEIKTLNEKYRKETNNYNYAFYSTKKIIIITTVSDDYVSIFTGETCYTAGAAHSLNKLSTATFNRKTGNQMKLSDYIGNRRTKNIKKYLLQTTEYIDYYDEYFQDHFSPSNNYYSSEWKEINYIRDILSNIYGARIKYEYSIFNETYFRLSNNKHDIILSLELNTAGSSGTLLEIKINLEELPIINDELKTDYN